MRRSVGVLKGLEVIVWTKISLHFQSVRSCCLRRFEERVLRVLERLFEGIKKRILRA